MWTVLLLAPLAADFDTTAVAQEAREYRPEVMEVSLVLPQDDLKEEYDKRRKAAAGDVDKLWALANWCDANGMNKQFRSCLRAILKIDDTHKKAHELLGHVYYDGQWFLSEKKLEAYKRKREAELRKEQEKRAKELGLVEYKGEWVAPSDIPYLEKGYVRDATGAWIHPEDQKKKAEGWVKQDLVWVAPDEKEKMDQGLWKCGEEWLTLEKANEYRGTIETCWKIPGSHFVIYSTCDRDTAKKALKEAEDSYGDLVRIFGVYPTGTPHFLILKNRREYGTFAAGDEFTQRPGADALGMSSVHAAFFADIWFEIEPPPPRFMGAGVTYWDKDDANDSAFAPLWTRHAAGLTFVEGIDPSTKTLNNTFDPKGKGEFSLEAFYKEKLLPAWLRYGGAAYAERYYIDKAPGANPTRLREWSVDNITRNGGLERLDNIFEMAPSGENLDGSAHFIKEAGLLVAFMIDGNCPPVVEAHGAFKEAFKIARANPKERRQFFKAVSNLQKVLKKNEEALRTWAKL